MSLNIFFYLLDYKIKENAFLRSNSC